MERITLLRQELIRVDKLLSNLDKALDNSQPNIEGKIRIFFWKAQARSDKLEPFVVRRSDSITKYPDKLKEKDLARRALSWGQFARNYNQTKELLRLASELLAYRKRIAETINESENRCQGIIRGNRYRLVQALDRLKFINGEVKRNLTQDGLEDYYQELDNFPNWVPISQLDDKYIDDTL